MTAPAGSCESSVTGGGDCRTLPEAVKLLPSSFSLSAVPGGVGSRGLVANVGVLTEAVRLCRVRYDVDRGSSGLGDDNVDVDAEWECEWECEWPACEWEC